MTYICWIAVRLEQPSTIATRSMSQSMSNTTTLLVSEANTKWLERHATLRAARLVTARQGLTSSLMSDRSERLFSQYNWNLRIDADEFLHSSSCSCRMKTKSLEANSRIKFVLYNLLRLDGRESWSLKRSLDFRWGVCVVMTSHACPSGPVCCLRTTSMLSIPPGNEKSLSVYLNFPTQSPEFSPQSREEGKWPLSWWSGTDRHEWQQHNPDSRQGKAIISR